MGVNLADIRCIIKKMKKKKKNNNFNETPTTE